MADVMKHLGNYKGSKAIVVLTAIVNPNSALIVQSDNLPGYVQDEVILILTVLTDKLHKT